MCCGRSNRHELGGCSAEDSGGAAVGMDGYACETVASAQRALVSAVEPLLMAYGVDVYHAGHVHDYESTWPIANGSITQPSFDAPQGHGRSLRVACCILRVSSPMAAHVAMLHKLNRACVRACMLCTPAALCSSLEPATALPTLQSTLERSDCRRFLCTRS
jgi:hypothetical protein